jgi:hypothetical protein
MSTGAILPGRHLLATAIRRRGLHEFGLLCLLTMETSWLVPWFRSLTPGTRLLPTSRALILFLGIALASMVVSRTVLALRLKAAIRSGLLLVLLAASLVLSLRLVVFPNVPLSLPELIVRSFTSFASVLTIVPNELIVVGAVLFLWRTGIAASKAYLLDPGSTAHKLRLGVLALVLFAVVHRDDLEILMLEVLPLYFGAGLTAVALSRVDTLSQARGAGRSPFTVQWLAAVLLLTAGTLALGNVAGVALQSPTGNVLGAQGINLMVRLMQLGVLIISPIVVGVAMLAEWLLNLVRPLLPESLSLERIRLNVPFFQMQPSQQAARVIPWLETYGAQLRIIGTSLVIAVIALAVVRGLRRSKREAEEPVEDIGESAGGRSGLLDGLVQSLSRFRDGFGAGRFLRLGRHLAAASAIRRVYAQLLDLAARRGRGRDPAETPLEFLKHLRRLFPDHEAEVTTITDAYLQVRYGELPEEERVVASVRDCWVAIREAARQAEKAPQPRSDSGWTRE